MRVYVEVARAGLAGHGLERSSGIVRVTVLDRPTLRIGDRVALTSRIRFPRNDGNPGEFDYEAFMARNRIRATMTMQAGTFGTPAFQIIGYRPRFPATQIEAVRDRIGAFIDANLPWPERAEMRALVIGDRGGIDDALRAKFARTGMAHLLVISGLHLSFVAAAIFALVRLAMMLAPGLASRGYANKAAAIAAGLAVCGYAAIAGDHISTSRALVMVLAYMLAVLADRSREALSSLALAAIVICFALPGSTADIGFQLSFASVIAIILGMRRFAVWYKRRERRGRLPGEPRSRAWAAGEPLLGYLAVSFWAMLGTAPLTAFHFNQFSMVGIVANAIVVPMMGFAATMSGLVASTMSFVWMPAARAVLRFGGMWLRASDWLAGWFVAWPLAWSRIFTPTAFEMTLAYGLLILWLRAPLRLARAQPVSPEQRSKLRFGRRSAAASLITIALALDAAWWIRDRYFNPDLRVTFLSVGEGDAAVVRFPGSAVMLIDAGGAYPGFDSGERIVGAYLWSKKIMRVDHLVMTHPDLDHFGGFDFVADNFRSDSFWMTGASSPDRSYAKLIATLARNRVPIKIVNASSSPMNIDGVSVQILNPEALDADLSLPHSLIWGRTKEGVQNLTHNNESLVMRLDFHGASFLFTGDIEAEAELAMLEAHRELHATVLKVPHHGSATSSTPAFVEAVHPSVAVVSDGYHNRFHFPAQSVIDTYREAGAVVLRTDTDGAAIADVGPTKTTLHSIRSARSVIIDRP